MNHIMKRVSILQIGDMQNGFIQKEGNLYVPGAENLIDPANDFLRQVSEDVFDLTLIVLDTHFKEEYYETQESRQFPIHCEYGSRDWELAIDLKGAPNIRYMMKNNFSMWTNLRKRALQCTDPVKRRVYKNLFHILDDPHTPSECIPRDEFLKAFFSGSIPAEVEVTLIGVASDYCNRYSMEGWLSRGARVTILQDLTKGIEKETPLVLAEDRYRCYIPESLRAVESTVYLKEMAD
ncbi:MAG: Isochorismatase family protein [Methanoregulaceae archaeon PtaB.Bin009]|jgi:nicotinamidase-related amidase|nr:MAG: Isochorismatase family protein [Methanoregulaceae archaeon PtaB.Bin009]